MRLPRNHLHCFGVVTVANVVLVVAAALVLNSDVACSEVMISPASCSMKDGRERCTCDTGTVCVGQRCSIGRRKPRVGGARNDPSQPAPRAVSITPNVVHGYSPSMCSDCACHDEVSARIQFKKDLLERKRGNSGVEVQAAKPPPPPLLTTPDGPRAAAVDPAATDTESIVISIPKAEACHKDAYNVINPVDDGASTHKRHCVCKPGNKMICVGPRCASRGNEHHGREGDGGSSYDPVTCPHCECLSEHLLHRCHGNAYSIFQRRKSREPQLRQLCVCMAHHVCAGKLCLNQNKTAAFAGGNTRTSRLLTGYSPARCPTCECKDKLVVAMQQKRLRQITQEKRQAFSWAVGQRHLGKNAEAAINRTMKCEPGSAGPPEMPPCDGMEQDMCLKTAQCQWRGEWGDKGSKCVPRVTQNVSACLLVKEDNQKMVEWLAYHHYTLPLTKVIVCEEQGNREYVQDIIANTVWEDRIQFEYLLAGVDFYNDPRQRACLRSDKERGNETIATTNRSFSNLFHRPVENPNKPP